MRPFIRLQAPITASFSASSVQRLDQIDRQIDAIDKELRALRNADDALRRRFGILTSIPGVGEVTTHALLVETPELGRLVHTQIASLTGLAPLARDSGQWRGKRSIKGGRPRPRLVRVTTSYTTSGAEQALVEEAYHSRVIALVQAFAGAVPGQLRL